MSLKVTRAFTGEDSADIVEFLSEPHMWEQIAGDGMKKSDINIDLVAHVWLTVRLHGLLVGVFHFHLLNGATAQGHAHVLRGQRSSNSQACLKGSLNWLFSNYPEVNTVVSMIPTSSPRAAKFALNGGLSQCGKIPKAYRAEGALQDLELFAITREEFH